MVGSVRSNAPQEIMREFTWDMHFARKTGIGAGLPLLGSAMKVRRSLLPPACHRPPLPTKDCIPATDCPCKST